MTKRFENEEEVVNTRNLDVEIKAAQDAIAMAEAMVRLEKNPDFKRIIEVGYFKDFAHNLVMQRSFPEMRGNEAMIEANLRKIDSIGELNFFFRGVKAMGVQSERTLKEARSLEKTVSLVRD
jgi:hypothetical protein